MDKGKVTWTVWTTLLEILQEPKTGSHRILRRIIKEFLEDLFPFTGILTKTPFDLVSILANESYKNYLTASYQIMQDPVN